MDDSKQALLVWYNVIYFWHVVDISLAFFGMRSSQQGEIIFEARLLCKHFSPIRSAVSTKIIYIFAQCVHHLLSPLPPPPLPVAFSQNCPIHIVATWECCGITVNGCWLFSSKILMESNNVNSMYIYTACNNIVSRIDDIDHLIKSCVSRRPTAVLCHSLTHSLLSLWHI